MTKIISITKNRKQRPLTPLMIKTLTAACEMQGKHKAFGQKDLDGSFIALLKREFIASKTTTVNGKTKISWFVTAAGIESLRNLGFTGTC